MQNPYTIILSDYEVCLPELALIIRAAYHIGEYTAAEDEFFASGADESIWTLRGTDGEMRIRFERYEGYYFSDFMAKSSMKAKEGRQLLWRYFLAQGGNPDAQEAP